MCTNLLHFLVLYSIFCDYVVPASETASPEALKGPLNSTVTARGLINTKVTSEDILKNYQGFFREVDEYNFDGLVLGYVTPWNNHGYDIAKIFGNKFTHISPVWLQLLRRRSKRYEIQGTHDVDENWMVTVRNAGRERKVKIVPRIIFDQWTANDYNELFRYSDRELPALVDALTSIAKKHRFDGFVLEVWSQIAPFTKSDHVVDVIKKLADGLAVEALDVILVVPPYRGDEAFTSKHFDALYEHFTAFSLMTYDFSNPQRPGPNAPHTWVTSCVEKLTTDMAKRKKILTGLNFYGYEYFKGGGAPIVGDEYIKRLGEFDGAFQYEPEYEEHYYMYTDDKSEIKHYLFYPTLHSLNLRINLINELNTGVSIWELGQGLDYFYDLL